MKIDIAKGLRTLVWFHFDDTFVSLTHEEDLRIFEEILSLKFKVTADCDISSHLGITLTKGIDGSFKLSQTKLLHKILEEYPTISHSIYTARVEGRPKDDRRIPPIEQSKYLRLLGQLMHVSNTRPDIITSLSYAATKCKDPTEEDYLRQTENNGLTLYPRDNTENKAISRCGLSHS